jgi:hypothetical protein
VGCEFCYLGDRTEDGSRSDENFVARVAEALDRLDYEEVAVALSEPVDRVLPQLGMLLEVVLGRRRKFTVTTTLDVARRRLLPLRVSRVNLSLDPVKGAVSVADAREVASIVRASDPAPEVVLIVSLSTVEFAHELIEGGLLERLVDLGSIDGVVLNGLKPPPPFCDRAFWLQALGHLRPLLRRELDRRLFLDCYVAARLLGLGGCPGRVDLSPSKEGIAFRACVYQAAPDLITAHSDELVAHLDRFEAPAACPFPTRL